MFGIGKNGTERAKTFMIFYMNFIDLWYDEGIFKSRSVLS